MPGRVELVGRGNRARLLVVEAQQVLVRGKAAMLVPQPRDVRAHRVFDDPAPRIVAEQVVGRVPGLSLERDAGLHSLREVDGAEPLDRYRQWIRRRRVADTPQG